MENKQTEKTQAELYREERKKRMESAAKKKAAKNPKAEKIKSIIGKVVSIVLAVAIIIGSVAGILNFFGLPQKVLTAAKVGGESVSIAKYNYYYMDIYLDLLNTSKQYDSYYGEGAGAMYTGYDATKSPMEQEYTIGNLEGFDSTKKPTWADYINVKAKNYVQSFIAYSTLAREAGMTLTDEEKKTIDEQIEQVRKSATDNDFSLDRFLIKQYGKGVSEKLLRVILEERILASNFAKQKQTEFSDAITDVIVQEEYDKNIKDFATTTLYAFIVTPEEANLPDTATEDEKNAAKKDNQEKAKAKAEAYASKVNSTETLLKQAQDYNSSATEQTVKVADVTGNDIKTSFGDAGLNWCFEEGRKVGDVTCIENGGKYVVMYMSVLPHKDTVKPVNVRHILFQFPTEGEDGAKVTLTEAQKLEYKKKAQTVYDEYLKNPTEDNFAALATKNSEDTGSKENGGLYEAVKVGDMVTEFNDWIFNPARKTGDTEIILTQYGYHIMYYVNNNNPESWQTSVKDSISKTKYEAYDKEVLGGERFAIKESKVMTNWASKQLQSVITKQYIKY